MENNWEYDYSGIYQNSYTPNNNGYQAYHSAPDGAQAPVSEPSAPMGPDLSGGQPPKKKKGRAKKFFIGCLCVLAVGTVSFGGGFAGYMAASQMKPETVIRPAESEVEIAPEQISRPALQPVASGDLVAVSNAVSPSVVVVTTDQLVTDSFWGGTQVVSGAGSGVIYTADGYILTNNHVVADAQKVTVKLYDGKEYEAQIVGTDPQTDMAVLRIDAHDLTPAVLGDSDQVQVGQTVIAVGNPMGTLGGTITNGIISGIDRSINVGGTEMKLLQTNAAVSPGNSGGGLFNANGELVGIVNAKSAGEHAEGLGFAIPVNTADKVARDLIENGYVAGRPVLGIMVIEVNDVETAFQLGVTKMGVYVQDVTEGSGADKAGLEAGDLILTVGDVLVEHSADVLTALSECSAGDTVRLQIAREGKVMTVDVVLGERTN